METKQLEKVIKELQTNYKFSAYMEGQRSVLLFIKSMLQNKEK